MISLEFISPVEAAAWGLVVKGARAHYTDREGFFTLGAAAYLDGPEEYPQLAKTGNQILSTRFNLLYKRLTGVLEEHFQKPVLMGSEALPGFHIFGYSPGKEASVHVDTPHERVLRFKELQYSTTFSFTVPLELPHSGGGLHIWDTDGIPQYHEYQLGRLYMHSGKELHQIANTVQEGELRITLQGHGIHTGTNVQVFF